MTEPLLVVDELTKHFPAGGGIGRRRVVHAVDGVSLSIQRGEVLSLVGESGSGKSTLGRCIAGMSPPTSGRIVFDGVDIATLRGEARARFRRRVQPVFQDPRSSLDPRWPVSRTIGEALTAGGIGEKAGRGRRIRELMDLVGLPRHLEDRIPRELSGGQQQRVAIAAALASEPELLVADEPVSALDVSVQAQILNLLDTLRRELGLTLLFIAHDLSVVEHLSDRVAVMYLGRLVESGTAGEVFEDARHPYSTALMAAIPYPDPARPMSRAGVVGEIPSPISPPSGCRFHTRCPVALPECAERSPLPTRFTATHEASCFVAAGDVAPLSASTPIPN